MPHARRKGTTLSAFLASPYAALQALRGGQEASPPFWPEHPGGEIPTMRQEGLPPWLVRPALILALAAGLGLGWDQLQRHSLNQFLASLPAEAQAAMGSYNPDWFSQVLTHMRHDYSNAEIMAILQADPIKTFYLYRNTYTYFATPETLQQVLDNAEPTALIILRPGIYTGGFTVDNNITLIALPGSVIFVADGKPAIDVLAAEQHIGEHFPGGPGYSGGYSFRTYFSGITFIGQDADALLRVQPHRNTSSSVYQSVTLDGCTFLAEGDVRALADIQSSSATIQRNLFLGGAEHGLRVADSNYLLINQNIITGAGAGGGIHLYQPEDAAPLTSQYVQLGGYVNLERASLDWRDRDHALYLAETTPTRPARSASILEILADLRGSAASEGSAAGGSLFNALVSGEIEITPSGNIIAFNQGPGIVVHLSDNGYNSFSFQNNFLGFNQDPQVLLHGWQGAYHQYLWDSSLNISFTGNIFHGETAVAMVDLARRTSSGLAPVVIPFHNNEFYAPGNSEILIATGDYAVPNFNFARQALEAFHGGGSIRIENPTRDDTPIALTVEEYYASYMRGRGTTR